MNVNLETTNLLLGVMAAVSVIEALFLVGVAIAGLVAYKRLVNLVSEIEARHIAPTTARVNEVLGDLKTVSATVRDETARVDHAIHRTIDRVDATARRMRTKVAVRSSPVVGLVRGVRVALETLLEDRPAESEART
jgi:hypothetical protein